MFKDLTDEELKSSITNNLMGQLLEKRRISHALHSLHELENQQRQLEIELEKRTELIKPI